MPGTGYAGDPGLFGTIFGAARGLLSRTPVGRVVSTGLSMATGFMAGRRNPRQIGTLKGRRSLAGGGACPPGMSPHFRTGECAASPFGMGPRTPTTRVPGFRGFGQRLIPGGATGFEGGEVVPVGYHLNKTGYYRGGRPKSDFELEWVEPRSIAVRNRKRNALNPRAADRAIGRITSAKKFAAKLGRITIRKEC